MNESIETTGQDIDSAVARALTELGVSRDSVRVDVLEEPGRRLLGLGTRQARVRVTVVKPPTAATPPPAPMPVMPPAPPKPAPPTPVKAEIRPESVIATPVERPVEKIEKPVEKITQKPVIVPAAPAAPAVHEVDYDDDAPRSAVTDEELDHEAQVGAEALQQILNHMQLNAKVNARRADTDGHEEPHWLLEIEGQELGALIGHRGETLAALQYVTRLIASKGLERRANLVIDVEGYKSRRETMLRRLAKRMAEQAIERGRMVSLEPMPPHERRIIHLALRDNPSVTTESVGDGEKRKVTIIPKKNRLG